MNKKLNTKRNKKPTTTIDQKLRRLETVKPKHNVYLRQFDVVDGDHNNDHLRQLPKNNDHAVTLIEQGL